MVRVVTQLAQSHRQELDAWAQSLPIKTMSPSKEEENPLQFRGMEKPGNVPFKKQTLLN